MFSFKSSYLVLFFALTGMLMAWGNMAHTYSDGAPANRCGLYGTQPTCTSCHAASGTNNASNTLTLSGNATAYVPGQTYTVTVSAAAGSRYGFQLACVRNNNNASAGTFAIGAGTEIVSSTISGNIIDFIQQNTSSTSGSWIFNWTAPANDVGAVTFYLATNSANGNGNSSGDKIRTRTLALSAATPCTLAPPTTTTTTAIGTTNATFQWSAVAGASTYTVRGRRVGTATWTTLSPTANTSRTVTVLQACKNYEWQVQANCSSGSGGAFSASATFTTTGCAAKTEFLAASSSINNLRLLPNPAQHSTTLQYECSHDTELHMNLLDMSGKIIQQQVYSATAGSNEYSWSLTDVPAGYYVVTLTDGNTSVQQKLVVMP